MTSIHTSTQTSVGLDNVAPTTVSRAAIRLPNQPIISGINFFATEGTDGSDTITANSNDFYVFGFGGDDVITNAGSSAILLGGTGADRFVISNNTLNASVPDGQVLDFEQGIDKLDLSNFSVDNFSDLSISFNASGVAGSFAQVTNAVANLNVILTSTGGLNALNGSDFVFNGVVGSGGTTGGSTGGTIGNNPTLTAPAPIFTAPIVPEVQLNGGQLIQGNSFAQTLNGSSLGDVIRGSIEGDINDLADTLFGNGGSDQIFGGFGNDTAYGGSGRTDISDSDDFIFGGNGDDVLYGNAGNDLIIGGNGVTDTTDGNDILIGGAGNDTLLGNAGNDVLFGLTGNDTLHGGLGDDNYVFGFGSGVDVIASFEAGDTISILSGVNGFASAADVIAATSFGTGYAQIDLGNGDLVNILGISTLAEANITIISDLGLPA